MKIKEYRILMPMTAEECQIGNLWTLAKMNKENTGGGEGVVYVKSEEFTNKKDLYPGITDGSYSHKIYKLDSKVPWWVKKIIPKGKLELHEESWTAFPYSKSILQNTEAFKDKLMLKNESYMANDAGTQENIFHLPPDLLKKRKVVYIDITAPIAAKEYKASEDPTKFVSKKTGRGPLSSNWKDTTKPVMCVYKLVSGHAKFFGFQRKLEKFGQELHRKLFIVFHRRMFCWMDNWYGLTYADVRKIHEDLKAELAQSINKGGVVGDVFDDEVKSDDEDD